MSYTVEYVVTGEATGGGPLPVFEGRDLTYNYYPLLHHLGIADIFRPSVRRDEPNPYAGTPIGELRPKVKIAVDILREMSDAEANAIIRGGWGSKRGLLSELDVFLDRAKQYPKLYLRIR